FSYSRRRHTRSKRDWSSDVCSSHLPLIVDDIYQQVEGKATGKGYITGNFNNFDFHGNFDTEDVFVKPRFLNTNYFLNGQVIVDRHDGVIMDSLSVIDSKGGTV